MALFFNLSQTNIFECECAFYESVRKTIKQLRNSKGLPELQFCKTYMEDSNGILIMENLKQKGFQTTKKSIDGNTSISI